MKSIDEVDLATRINVIALYAISMLQVGDQQNDLKLLKLKRRSGTSLAV